MKTVAATLALGAGPGSFAQVYMPMLVPGNAWALHYAGLGGAINDLVELHEDSTIDGSPIGA